MVYIRKDKHRRIQVPSLPKELLWCEKYFDESIGRLPIYMDSLSKNVFNLYFRLPFNRGVEEKPLYAVWNILQTNEGKEFSFLSFKIVANNKGADITTREQEKVYEIDFHRKRKYHSNNPKQKNKQTIDDEWFVKIFDKLDGLIVKYYKNDLKNSIEYVESDPIGVNGARKEFRGDLFK